MAVSAAKNKKYHSCIQIPQTDVARSRLGNYLTPNTCEITPAPFPHWHPHPPPPAKGERARIQPVRTYGAPRRYPSCNASTYSAERYSSPSADALARRSDHPHPRSILRTTAGPFKRKASDPHRRRRDNGRNSRGSGKNAQKRGRGANQRPCVGPRLAFQRKKAVINCSHRGHTIYKEAWLSG